MDSRPIGIFDSGVGGLTAVRALIEAAPWESFVYLGDTANAPYGDKTSAELAVLSKRNVCFLRRRQVKALLVACNTSTANAMDAMEQASGGLPLAAVIAPAAKAAAAATRTGRIGVMATAATVRSGAYERAIRAALPTSEVTAVACPALVPLVESGRTDRRDPALASAVASYAAPLLAAGVDTVVLGCTHYPIIIDAIRACLGETVSLIDSGAASVGALLDTLSLRGALGDPSAAGERRFFCTAAPDVFASVGSAFLGWDISPATALVTL